MPPHKRFNYQHLQYFWAVVRHGSLTAACAELNLAAPTVSGQLRTLEQRLGTKLLARSGRRLVPTEAGRLVYGYADEIFDLGRSLVDAVARRPTRRPQRLAVGIDDVLPKEIAHRLLEGALGLAQKFRLICREGTLEQLVAALTARQVDVVLSDSPITPSIDLQAYNHELGTCAVAWMATAALARPLRARFPKSLLGAPLLLPTSDTALRRALDQWLDKHGVRPQIVGEFEDYALLREFARAGRGLAPVPVAMRDLLGARQRLTQVGVARGVLARFYAITVDLNPRHPAVSAIVDGARRFFAPH